MSMEVGLHDQLLVTCCIVLGLTAVPLAGGAAQPPAADNPVQQQTIDQKEKGGRGKFVSFKDGALILESNSGVLQVWSKIPDNSKTFKWDHEASKYEPVENTTAALTQVKAGTWVTVGDGKATIRIGAKKGQVTGTFVSYKDGRLLMIGKDLGESYTRKYGNNLHFNKFRDDVPIYESVDGGEYKMIGTANKLLGNVKEGTVLTVHGEGDDNITRVEMGVRKVPEPAPKPAAANVAPKERIVRGWFVSLEAGVLTVQNQQNVVRHKLPENVKTFVWNHDERRAKPVDTAEAMKQLKLLSAPISTLDAAEVETAETMMWRKAGIGLVVYISDDTVTIRIGENKTPSYVGNFVSFKDDSLCFRLKNPSPSFQKAYGDTVTFKMNETIPVYESIDGGEYQRIGTPRTVMSNVKEGTIITVYHNYKTETDEFYLILVGVKK